MTGTDAVGNPFSATTTSTHTVDTSASATISVDPITADDLVTAAEAGGLIAVTGTVGGDAAAGDTVSFTINSVNYSGTVNPDGTTWSINVAGADLAADTSFDATVTGTDAVGNPFSATTTSTHSVDIAAPVLAPQTFSYAENQIAGATIATVAASDNVAVTGFTFTATGTGTSADGYFQIDNGGNITMTAAGAASAVNDFETGTNSGIYSVTATDAAGNAASANITLNELNLNDNIPANTVPGAQAGTEDTGLTFSSANGNAITVADADGGTLTVTLSVAHGTLGATTGGGATITDNGTGTVVLAGTAAQINAALAGLTFAPTADYNGTDTLTVSTTDGTTTDVDTIAITLSPEADVVDDTLVTDEDTPITANVITGSNGASADGFEGAPTLTGVTDGAHGTVTFLADGSVTYTPDANWSGTDSFTYTVTSGGVTETAAVSVTVNPVNDAPQGTADSYAGTEGTLTTLGNVLSNDTDIDSLPASFVAAQFAASPTDPVATVNGVSSITTALGGTVIMRADGTFDYAAPARDHDDATADADSFVYKLSDGSALSDWITVNLDITDSVPVAHADSDSVGIGGTVAGNVITGAGGAAGGADALGADAAQITAVSFLGTPGVFAGGEWTLTTPNGTLTISPNGDYSYVSNLENVAVSGPTKSNWTSALGVYGFDSSSPLSGGNLNLGALGTMSNGANVTARSNGATDSGIGVETGGSTTGTNARIQTGESMVIDLGVTADSAAVTLSGLANGNSASWSAFDQSGLLLASGTIPGEADQIVAASVGVAGTRYLVFGHVSDNYLINGLSFSPSLGGLVPDVIDYTLTDADGSTSSSTLTVTTDSQPGAVADTGTVYESGLAAGTQAGVAPTVVTGNLMDNDTGVGGSVTITSVAGQPPGTNGIITVTDAIGTLTVYTQDYGGRLAGDYTYTLGGATTEGSTDTPTFSYTLTDGFSGLTSSATLTIGVVDDAPTGSDLTHTLQAASGAATYNLVIILDRSGSMAWDANGNSPGDPGFDPSTVRMDIAKDALAQLLDRFDEIGNVNVNVVDFSSDVNDSGWFLDNKYAATDYLNGLQPNGGTRYSAALNAAMDGFSAPAADKTLFYFISDGEPNAGYGVDATLQTQWEAFVATNGDIAFGIGIGEAGLGSLLPIAYPNTDTDGNGQEDYAIKVSNATDLANTLLATVDGGVVVGNVSVLSGGGSSGFLLGADGGQIQSVVVDGVTYSHVSGGPDSVTVTTSKGGELTLNYLTGAYEYRLVLNQTTQGQQEVFPVTAVDGDGDTKTLNMVINLDYVANLDANRDIVLTNITDGSPIDISAAALLHNDSVTSAGGITSVQNPVRGTVAGTDPIVFDSTGTLASPLAGTIAIVNEVAGDAYNNQLNDSRANAVDLTDRGLFGTVVPGGESLDINATGYTLAFRGTIDNNDSDASNQPDTDYVKVRLFAGEKLFIDIDNQTANMSGQVEYQDAFGAWQTIPIVESGSNPYGWFVAPQDGEYFLRLRTDSDNTNNASYELLLTISADTARDEAGSFEYTVTDGGAPANASVDIYNVSGTTITGTERDEILIGGSTNDTLQGGAGNDALLGHAGADQLDGGEGFDRLEGGADSDSLSGGTGNDVLLGGAGNDALTGGLGADIFRWELADAGASTVDTITDFDTTTGSDQLDLRDLLQGEIGSGVGNNLENYLHFEYSGSNTTVHISSSGGFAGGYAPGAEDQTILISGVNLIGSFTTDQQIIQDLLNKGKLITD
ncbi:MAG: hypothetical protein MOGDAGHF_00099 [Rhodocyclaceae bacterium]|nr:hypothetical protein [Rhodocyclaceae bacterium]